MSKWGGPHAWMKTLTPDQIRCCKTIMDEIDPDTRHLEGARTGWYVKMSGTIKPPRNLELIKRTRDGVTIAHFLLWADGHPTATARYILSGVSSAN